MTVHELTDIRIGPRAVTATCTCGAMLIAKHGATTLAGVFRVHRERSLNCATKTSSG
jgi:hypothetical protein